MTGTLGPLGRDREIAQPPPLNPLSIRLERWRLQAVARSVLPNHSIKTCKRAIIPLHGTVGVWKTDKCAHYTGLITCGSVWVCPICAAKISEGRRVELQKGMDRWKGQGGGVYLMTLTVPHYDHQPLAQVLAGFSKARRLLLNRKTWKGFKRDINLSGSVRALETTWGQNGWHVHSHELLYVNQPGNNVQKEDLPAEASERVLEMWQRACVSAGMDRPNDRGCKIHDGSYADKYASKWGLESEVTKGHIKAGRDGNHSPWDMLRAIGKGVTEMSALFQEFARCFRGRHQLEWSKGLRALLCLGFEVTDGDLAEADPDGGEFLGFLGMDEWRLILKAEKRGELLEVAYREGWAGVLNFIKVLVGYRDPGQARRVES